MAAAVPLPVPAEPAKSARLLSLDTYRGLIMLSLAANGFGLAATADNFAESSFWKAIRHQFDHPEWLSNGGWWGLGVCYWDLIQPSFMFMVGVAMPYSYARRAEEGESVRRQVGHAAIRSIVLIMMGVFLSSVTAKQVNWTFVNVLTQIGLGYFFLYFLQRLTWKVQLAVGAAVLVAYWGFFLMNGAVEAHTYADYFVKHTNLAARFDQWFLNLFPRAEPFKENVGGYATLNFVPSLVTMLFGVQAGQVLRSALTPTKKLLVLFGAAVTCLLLGVAWSHSGLCPIVKRIWTPSWTLFSGGYTFAILGAMYGVIDVARFRAWTFPLVVFGTNSMLVYWMGQLLRSWTAQQIKLYLGSLPWPFWTTDTQLRDYMAEGDFGPIVQSLLVTSVFWLFCYWLYRQRIFLRV